MSYEPHNPDPSNPESNDPDVVDTPTGDAAVGDSATSEYDTDPGAETTSAHDYSTDMGPDMGPGPSAADADFASYGAGTATMAPPPPPAAAPPRRRLVRDPFARLGGVASGLSHHYGIDVSVIRIIFVLATLASGFGLLVYLLAWLVIPRADYWPPAGQPRPLRSLTGRDLGLGLAVIGLMVALGFGAAGATGSILIPLVLVGGGVWLLIQPPNNVDTVSNQEYVAGYSGGGGADTPPPPAGYVPGGPAGAPVPPRSRKRRFAVIGVVGGLLLAFVAIPFLALIAFFGAVATGDLEFESKFESIGGERIIYTPNSIVDIPNVIDEDGGDIEIDLTGLDASDFDGRSTPVELNAQLEFGSIRVIVPDDVEVSVSANVDVGNVNVFDMEDDGFGPAVIELNNDADIELDLEVNVGEIEVVEG